MGFWQHLCTPMTGIVSEQYGEDAVKTLHRSRKVAFLYGGKTLMPRNIIHTCNSDGIAATMQQYTAVAQHTPPQILFLQKRQNIGSCRAFPVTVILPAVDEEIVMGRRTARDQPLDSQRLHAPADAGAQEQNA